MADNDEKMRVICEALEPIETLPTLREPAVVDVAEPSPLRWWLLVACYWQGDVPEWQPAELLEDRNAMRLLKIILANKKYESLIGMGEVDIQDPTFNPDNNKGSAPICKVFRVPDELNQAILDAAYELALKGELR